MKILFLFNLQRNLFSPIFPPKLRYNVESWYLDVSILRPHCKSPPLEASKMYFLLGFPGFSSLFLAYFHPQIELGSLNLVRRFSVGLR